jgi:ATP-dependent Clp protease ATP-binding subunit ClpC
MSKKVTQKLKKIINDAMIIASEMDDGLVIPEHITLSILRDGNNNCIEVLENLGVDINKCYDLVYDIAIKSEITPKIIANKTNIPFNDKTKKLFKSIDEICDLSGDEKVDVPHIMLGILMFNTPSKKILNGLGVNYDNFKEKIKNMKEENMFDDFEGKFSGSKDTKKTSKKPTTPVLDNFCRDISKLAQNGALDQVIGREIEIKRVSQILSRRKKNNPILIGEPGVGKTAIIEGLAMLINDGKAPRNLLGKTIFFLDLASIVAGTKYRGQFEERMKAILEELRANPNIVLFIDEIHTIVGAGNSAGALDASNIFKPALARGEVQVIGATTLDEFRENIEKDGALTRRFQTVLIEEPTLEETITILKNIRDKYEDHHKVTYTDEAIEECVKLSDRYIADRAMPDKAIDVLDEAGATTNVNVEVPKNIKKLEAEKDKINKEKFEVVNKQKYEAAAKLRDVENKLKVKLDKAKAKWVATLENERTIVDVPLIAEVVSMMTGIPIKKMTIQETKQLSHLDETLIGRVIGQDDAVGKVVKAIKRSRIGIKNKTKPIGSFIFLGPTGVGKCVCSDTEIIVRDKTTKIMEKTTIGKFKDVIKNK